LFGPEEPPEEGAPVPTETLPKFIERQEVVREDNMHYFNVPKLGAYMAVKL